MHVIMCAFMCVFMSVDTPVYHSPSEKNSLYNENNSLCMCTYLRVRVCVCKCQRRLLFASLPPESRVQPSIVM
jgi:hypothetical protein